MVLLCGYPETSHFARRVGRGKTSHLPPDAGYCQTLTTVLPILRPSRRIQNQPFRPPGRWAKTAAFPTRHGGKILTPRSRLQIARQARPTERMRRRTSRPSWPSWSRNSAPNGSSRILSVEHGFAGGYDSVKRFVRQLGRGRALPMRRMECAAGEEAQVDFGSGAPVVGPDGKRRKTHVFRIVLSHSRKAYSEATFRQTTEDFIGCLENAFWHFGGCPKVLVIDNLRAAVKHPDWFDPELVPKLRSFCQHYGIVILPTKPYMPRHKGKVESGVKYVQNNALKAKKFPSLQEQNDHLAHWEATVADTRIHGTTRQHVGRVFREAERPALQPLPRERFPCFQEAPRKVSRDGHVEVAKAYYSVPPEYLGHTVWARWDARLVRIFNQRFEQIATHVRHEQGRFSTHAQHLAPEKINGIERGVGYLLEEGPRHRAARRTNGPRRCSQPAASKARGSCKACSA